MTAAHCVDWRSGEWRVVVGEHDLNRDSGREQVMNVSGVHIHPTRKTARGYDIVLLRLHSDVSLNHYVQLAYIPPYGHILTHNTTCFITGWGRTSTNGHPSARLKQVHLPLVDHRTCTRDDW